MNQSVHTAEPAELRNKNLNDDDDDDDNNNNNNLPYHSFGNVGTCQCDAVQWEIERGHTVINIGLRIWKTQVNVHRIDVRNQ